MNKQYDLIVVGGGLSGVAAAVSAAREGLRVLLVEKSGCLGGAMSNNLVFPFMRYWTVMPETGEKKYLSAGLFAEMWKRERAYGNTNPDERYFKPDLFKLVLDDMVTEAGVEVLFHASLFKVKCKERTIKSVTVATISGAIELKAKFFIDTTGNGDLFALAGCEFQLGRESDGLCQPMTTCFRMNNADEVLFRAERPILQELYKQAKAEGKIQNPREDILAVIGYGGGILHFNTTRIVKCDPTDPFAVSRAEIEARRQVHEIVTFVKAHSKALANSEVISISTEIGIRESRKLKGEHILTVDELKALTVFEDSIALGNYDVDIHNPAGAGTSHYFFPKGDYYTIPYRSLLPREYDNLLVAGRCISATHEAQASIRIMPICTCLGEAAGTALAIAHKTGTDAHTVDIKAVQKKLRENGAKL